MQLWQASRATINMRSVTPWVRTCFTRWRRTTVSPVSAAARCDPSPSVSWITSDRRSSQSAVLWNACPASSHVVCKRWSAWMPKTALKSKFSSENCQSLWYRTQRKYRICMINGAVLFIPSFHPLLSLYFSCLSWRSRLLQGTQWDIFYSSGTLSSPSSP